VKYIPINEQVDLNLGSDSDVMVKPTMTNWAKTEIRFDNRRNVTGWTETQWWQIEVQNSKNIPIVVDVRRSFAGDWEMASRNQHEKIDATKVKFISSLMPREKTTLTYVLTTRHGTNARK
jgi:hypothetical protein